MIFLLKLARYLKPYALGLVFTAVLLFTQAAADLSLPNYMADIVNVGIQQNGVEYGPPVAFDGKSLELFSLFLSAENKALVLKHYQRSGANALYPLAENGVYIRQKISAETENALSAVFAALWQNINQVSQEAGLEGTESGQMNYTPDLELIYRTFLTDATFTPPKASPFSVNEAFLKQNALNFTAALYAKMGGDIYHTQTSYMLKKGLYMLIIALIGGGAAIGVSFFAAKTAGGAARDLRRDVFGKIESFSHAEFDTFSAASLITRCTNDISQIQMLLMMGIRLFCLAPIMGIGGIIMALRKSPSMSWIIALAVIVILGIVLIMMTAVMPKFKLLQKLTDKINLISRENLSGLMVIRAFNTQKDETRRFEYANGELTAVNLFVTRAMAFLMPMMMLIMNILAIVILWTGGGKIMSSSMMVGDILAFIQYAMQVVMSFLMLSMIFVMAPRAAVSANRVYEVLAAEIKVKDASSPVSFKKNSKGLIEFKDVYFKYGDAAKNVLNAVSFVVEPGKTTAVIGATGAGKTTVANLLMRFYDVSAGSIKIDGTDIRDVSQAELRGKIGYVPQKALLLKGTIASNIGYGKENISFAQMEKAAAAAQALDFINGREEGFSAEIAQGGGNISGGQKQRLAIARALAKNPEILIFDDSFSALDFKTDAALRKALKENAPGAAIIMIAQRVSTIMEAEQIIVMDRGRIVGIGKHKELLQSCAEYFAIASTQLSREELA